ncbi:hypothetical protein B7492_07790 [Bacillus mycoides]|uniref:Resolvase HTH domain-containing protein n=1 Tax=Bacillus mycoides TaxID=1405 RepID=A0A1W6A5N8_BACMY|nr:hypothetical protein [Bacillus mycoides]ARJ21147.1 hypothetical protein B7492_07790 [Bacillus mycoides]
MEKTRRKSKKNTNKKWDDICRQAAVLLEQGLRLKDICKQLDLDTNSLYRQLKSRGIYPLETQEIRIQKNKEKWDSFCEKAVVLQKLGMSYSKISKHLGCHTASLCTELKKRELN